MRNFRKLCLGISVVFLVFLVFGLITQNSQIWQPAAVALSVTASLGIGIIPVLSNYQYTAWIVTAVVAGMIYPSAFLNWGSFDLRNKWLILLVVQLVMFGMGIQMALKDFTGPTVQEAAIKEEQVSDWRFVNTSSKHMDNRSMFEALEMLELL